MTIIWVKMYSKQYAWSLSQFETPWKLFLCNTRQEIVFFSELGKSCWSQNICLHENIAFSTKITMGNKLRKYPGTSIFNYLLPSNQSIEWGDKNNIFLLGNKYSHSVQLGRGLMVLFTETRYRFMFQSRKIYHLTLGEVNPSIYLPPCLHSKFKRWMQDKAGKVTNPSNGHAYLKFWLCPSIEIKIVLQFLFSASKSLRISIRKC